MKLKITAAVLLSLLACFLFSVSASAQAEDKIVIVLDAGHGGHDPGTTVGTRSEADYNYDVALLLKEKLEATGDFEVHLTRARDEYKKYLLRAQVAYDVDADLLLSLHFNSYGWYGSSPNGVEVLGSVLDEWYPHTLAESIAQSIASECGLRNGGVKRVADTGDARGVYYWNEALCWDMPDGSGGRKSDYYSMIAWGTKLGFLSLIVEHAYLSNPSDLAFADSADGLNRLAEAEAKAIIAYFTGHTHTYAAETCDRSANCSIGGVYSEKCTVCSHRRNVRHTAPDESVHAWMTSSGAATCTSDGYVYRECQISRNLSEKGFDHVSVHSQRETYAATGHNLITEVDTEASHGVNGLFRQRCTTCGAVFDEVRYGEAHNYVKTESTPAACEADGRDTYECTICAHTYTDVTEAFGHVWETDGKEINCASDATLVYTCKTCAATSSETVELPPHTLEKREEIAPTCEEDGYKLSVCTVCGFEEKEILSATGHDFTDECEAETPATFFTDGERVYKCKNDSSHEKRETVPNKAPEAFVIISASAGIVLFFALTAWLLISAGHRRLRETALKAGEALEAMAEEAETREGGEASLESQPEKALCETPAASPTEPTELIISAEPTETETNAGCESTTEEKK